MKFFEKRKTEEQLKNQLFVAQKELEVRADLHRKEIAMWQERGDRLSGSYDSSQKELERTRNELTKLYSILADVVKTHGQSEAFQQALEFLMEKKKK